MKVAHPDQINLVTYTDTPGAAVKHSYWNKDHTVLAEGKVTFADADTEKVIAFADQLAATFEIVIIGVRAASAAAPWLDFRIKNGTKTDTGATIEASSNPGTGESVVVTWAVMRIAP